MTSNNHSDIFQHMYINCKVWKIDIYKTGIHLVFVSCKLQHIFAEICLIAHNNYNVHWHEINRMLPVNEILCLLACSDQLNDGVKHLCAIRLFLLFKNKHEVMTKACLHHYPVNGAGQVNVSCQEYNIFTCIQLHQHTAEISFWTTTKTYTATFDFGLPANFFVNYSGYVVPKVNLQKLLE